MSTELWPEFKLRSEANKEKTVIKASKLTEIIILNDLSKFPEKKKEDYQGKIPKKSELDIKNLVGKRVNIQWKSGQFKGWHKGTIIGYTSNLLNSLIYYDTRNIDVDPSIDYYSANLLTNNQINW